MTETAPSPTRRFTRLRAAGSYALAAAACLIASFVNFLTYNDYPLGRPEVAIGVLGLLALAAALGLLCSRLTKREQTLLSALFLALIVEMNFDGGPVIMLGTVAVAIALKSRAIAAAGVTFFVVLLIQTAQALVAADEDVLAPMPTASAQRPAIVHVILDEAIGIEGLPKDIPEATAAAAWARDRLIADGFLVFGRAFAQHMHTVNSVPQILSLGTLKDGTREGLHYRLSDTGYWAALKARGYSLKVFQNQFASYCPSSAVDVCSTAADYAALADSPLSVGDKAAVLLRSFAALSDPLQFLVFNYDRAVESVPALAAVAPRLGLTYVNVPPALGAMASFDDLLADVARARPGQAYFAHLLMPHHPYAYDASCRLLPEAEWSTRRAALLSREQSYRAYVEQWRCAVSRIGELVRALEAARPERDFVVIVHGDHGSRVVPVDPDATNAEALPRQSFRDAYSALVAIRLPGQPAGYDREPATVGEILKQVVANDFRGPVAVHGTRPPAVVLVDPDDWEPERRLAAPWLFDQPNP